MVTVLFQEVDAVSGPVIVIPSFRLSFTIMRGMRETGATPNPFWGVARLGARRGWVKQGSPSRGEAQQ